MARTRKAPPRIASPSTGDPSTTHTVRGDTPDGGGDTAASPERTTTHTANPATLSTGNGSTTDTPQQDNASTTYPVKGDNPTTTHPAKGDKDAGEKSESANSQKNSSGTGKASAKKDKHGE